jgi:hypothetical protein
VARGNHKVRTAWRPKLAGRLNTNKQELPTACVPDWVQEPDQDKQVAKDSIKTERMKIEIKLK